MLRGIRGAITVPADEAAQIHSAVRKLLETMVAENKIRLEDVGAVIFSSTPDLRAAFPAAAARAIGWSEVPLFGTQEIENPDGVRRCIRILILWNTEVPQHAVRHAYLEDAAALRQDLSGGGTR